MRLIRSTIWALTFTASLVLMVGITWCWHHVSRTICAVTARQLASQAASATWNHALAGSYSEAGADAVPLRSLPPEFALEIYESVSQYGKPLDDTLALWEDSLSETRETSDAWDLAVRTISSQIREGRRQRDAAVGRALRPVTGMRSGYFTARIGKVRGLLILPTEPGVVVELRILPLPAKRWPSRSIQETSPWMADEAADGFYGVAERTPRLRLVGFVAGNWSAIYPSSGSQRTYKGDGKFLLVPYWFLLLITAILPARAVLRWCIQFIRHRRGLCRFCGYDIRATPNRCPECGAGKDAPREGISHEEHKEG